MIRKLVVLGVLALVAVLPASAITFLQFGQPLASATPFILTDGIPGGCMAPSPCTTLNVSAANITYTLGVASIFGLAPRAGTLTFSATSSAWAQDAGGGNIVEHGFSGTGSLLDSITGFTVLTWTFGPAGSIVVNEHGTGGTFTDSRPAASEVIFNSAYLNFGSSTTESFSFGFSNPASLWTGDSVFTQPVSQGYAGVGNPTCTNCRIASNAASFTGTFDADGFDEVPEPATMALFGSALLGLGLIGRKRFVR